MPIKVDVVKPVVLHGQNKLFKNEINNKKQICYTGGNIIRNSHFNSLQNLVFLIIDRIHPIKKKHPKIYKRIINIGEKMLKNSDELQKIKI